MARKPKGQSFIWTKEYLNAFDGIKATIIQDILIVYPKYAESFDVHTYASDYIVGGGGGGGILEQQTGSVCFTQIQQSINELYGNGNIIISHCGNTLKIPQYTPKTNSPSKDRSQESHLR